MRNTLVIVLGWLLVIVGTILFPLPVPLGAPALALGLLILARQSRWMRQLIARLRQRFPRTSRSLSVWARRRRIGSLKDLDRETNPDRLFSRPPGNRPRCPNGHAS